VQGSPLRLYVLIGSEEIFWIVLFLERRQALVLVSVRGMHSIFALIFEVIHINTEPVYSMNLPIVTGSGIIPVHPVGVDALLTR
jgi:hypothetical protein